MRTEAKLKQYAEMLKVLPSGLDSKLFNGKIHTLEEGVTGPSYYLIGKHCALQNEHYLGQVAFGTILYPGTMQQITFHRMPYISPLEGDGEVLIPELEKQYLQELGPILELFSSVDEEVPEDNEE